jgi:hypothetical protein
MHAAGSGLQGLRVRPRRWREIEEPSEEIGGDRRRSEIGGDRRRSWEIVGDSTLTCRST